MIIESVTNIALTESDIDSAVDKSDIDTVLYMSIVMLIIQGTQRVTQ